jgi:voltage-gated potassium channel
MGERRRESRVERIERRTEPFMLLLAFVYLMLIVARFLPETPAFVRASLGTAEFVIIAVFAVELAVRVWAAEQRLAYLRRNWLSVLIVVLPFLRPLRLLLLLPFFLRTVGGLQRLLGRFRGAYVLAVAALSVFMAALLMLAFERRANPEIEGFGDAVWWAFVTITTVGYGDIAPLTPEGRAVATFLMVLGITLFGVLTAGLAAFFVEGSAEEGSEGVTTRDVLDKLEALERRVEEQNRILESLKREDRARR